MFQNMISSTLECPECNFHTYSFDPSIILTVPIPNERKVDMEKVEEQLAKLKHLPEDKLQQIKRHLIISQCNNQTFQLDECFANLVNKERLDDTNKWFCPHCKDKVNASKKFNIWIPPKIMIVQLKRFIHNFSAHGYSAHKLNNKIEYPINGFDISPHMSTCSKKVSENSDGFKYDLIAVSNHIGNMNGGHYYSFIKSVTDGNWYCTDDDSVTLMQEEDIVSPNAYLLFYKQREN
jgi:ubiquitin carboxyl-terminal hydrolase 4/11/15